MINRYQMKLARFVEEVAARLGITDERVIAALSSVPRHVFVEEALAPRAYTDDALPIGYGQTISKVSTVAMMTSALNPQPKDKVLEIGTGSAYQAAVLSKLASTVYSIERIAGLAVRAQGVLNRLGLYNVRVSTGDGSKGWPEEAPFDKIIVTAAAGEMPSALLAQLAVGGRLVAPVGEGDRQVLRLVTRTDTERWEEWDLDDCRFVPLIAKGGGGS